MKQIGVPTSEDRKYFFSKIPWSVDDGSGTLISIVNEKEETQGLCMYNAHVPKITNGKHDNEGGSIFLSALSMKKTWMLGNTVRLIVYYPFSVLKCTRLMTITPIFNKSAIRLDKKYGFVFEGLLKNYFEFDNIVCDGVLLTLYKEIAIELGYISNG